MTREIVISTMNSMMMFHSNVKLPEGTVGCKAWDLL